MFVHLTNSVLGKRKVRDWEAVIQVEIQIPKPQPKQPKQPLKKAAPQKP